MWCFPLVFIGFAILAGMWPFHTWAPTGHVAAPTAASMLLAGVVMKLGAYGCLRVGIGLFPHGLDPWGFSFSGIGSWRDVFALLAIIGIVYGALVALAQSDFKFVIGYSQRQSHGLCAAGTDDAEPDWRDRRGAADVLARHHRRPAVRHCGPNRVRPNAYAAVCRTGNDAPGAAAALCGMGVCDCGNGLDGTAWLLRLYGRVAGADWRMEGRGRGGRLPRAWAL